MGVLSPSSQLSNQLLQINISAINIIPLFHLGNNRKSIDHILLKLKLSLNAHQCIPKILKFHLDDLNPRIKYFFYTHRQQSNIINGHS